MSRVLYLYAQAYREGSAHGRATIQMLALLNAAGVKVDLLTLPGGDPWPKGLVANRYYTARVPFVRTLPHYGMGLRRGWATTVLAIAAIRLFIHRRYAAVHCADRAVQVGGLVAWLFGARFIFEWHTGSGHDLVDWLRRRPKRFQRAISLILSDISYPFSRLRETGLYGRFATIPALPHPGIIRRLPPAARLRGSTQPFRVTVLAHRCTPDGISPLGDALPDLLLHPNLSLRIVGGTPVLAERLRKALARRLPATSNLEVRPAAEDISDLNQLLADTDVIFLPMAHGILPPPIVLDVMSACRPIVAIRCPAYAAILNDTYATLIPATAQAILEALQRHMLTPLLCAEHATAALDVLERDYAFSAVAASLRACYTFALTEPRA